MDIAVTGVHGARAHHGCACKQQAWQGPSPFFPPHRGYGEDTSISNSFGTSPLYYTTLYCLERLL